MSNFAIKTENLTKIYNGGEIKTCAINSINIEIPTGALTAIIGPSGHGKSTLLHLIGGLDRPTRGRIFVGGDEITAMKDSALAELRAKKIGFVFQFFNLFRSLNALENIQAAMMFGPGKANSRARALELLDMIGLSEKARSKPGELSGGQQQRIAIARALANEPDILLMDEPTGNLDSQSEREVMSHIHDIHKAGKTIVMVTHNIALADTADIIFEIKDGTAKPFSRSERT